MPYGLYLSAQGAQAQFRRLEVIANNLANVDTVGFKRDVPQFQAYCSEAVETGKASAGSGSINDVSGGVMLQKTTTNYAPGPLKHTDVPTDMAVQCNGYFVVQKDGENLLTRAGNFMLNNNGELVTPRGYRVMNADNTPVAIDQANGPWTVSPTGEVRQRGTSQKLALVRPASLGDLSKQGDNFFRPLAPTEAVPDEERRVVHGYLEMSGVQPTTQLIDMIEASRAVEANMSLIQTQDQMTSGLINRVLKA
jgi:flagellar basal-body rod protein FlgF